MLQRAQFDDSILRVAKLRGADLTEVSFTRAKLISVDFTGAKLDGTDLTGANFIGSGLENTRLTKAKFCNTKFHKTLFGGTTFGDIDFSSCKGLTGARHSRSSIIGTDTIHKSKGKIPVEFLRGCGLSDLDIVYAKLAAPGLDPEQVSQIIYEIHKIYLDQPIRFYDSFISYNNQDEEFAQRLSDDLQNSGVRCWFAKEDMKIGDRIRLTIDRQIRMREKLIVILSENSIQSEWVGDEVEAAMEQEKVSGKNVLFPISLDNTVFETRDDWAAKIRRRRSIGNFSKWKDEVEYQKMFDRLLRDLKASGEE